MSAEVIVKLAPDAEQRQVLARAAELNLTLEPLHPATDDAELSSYFVGSVADAAATGVAERLLRCDAVQAAYAKPLAAPPERSTDHVR